MNNMNMINYLIFHGHFYQPPREDPWTGLVPTQPSAAPFHDWNSKITRECYAANAASRFLRYDGRIEDIINNYKVLSFNIGPTLMWWLHQYAPQVYEAIVEADRLSVEEQNGHGNAIAQAYNHTILPLDNPRDAGIQIKWGLSDFEFHFGRRSEGIWLPEAAVNDEVLDILIEEGIRFIILSPWQAEAYFTEGMKEWKELKDEPIPFWRPYKIVRPRGSISIFFYNHELAQGISFDHYLRSADGLYSRLLRYHNNADPSHLIHTATDGEIYGHHEPYGDMCLAALQRKITEKEDFIFTNYGAYLERHPAVYQVRLRPGEEDKGSSWSCHHGVSRWYKDCGCSTGGQEGWNQKWRTPLRTGLKHLSDNLWKIYRRELTQLTATDACTLLEAYSEVLTSRCKPVDFAGRHLFEEKRGADGVAKLLTLLEGQKYRLYSFTSCGWFFSDINGIEARQNLRYALKAIRLYKNLTDSKELENLSDILEAAVSNQESGLNGREIIEELNGSVPGDGIEAATYFVIRRLIYKQEQAGDRYGYFKLLEFETEREDDNFFQTSVRTADTSRNQEFHFSYKIPLDEDEELKIRIIDLLQQDREEYIEDLSKLPSELRYTLMKYLIRSTEAVLAEEIADTFDQIKLAISQSRFLGIEAPRLLEKTAESAVTTLLQRELNKDGGYLNADHMQQFEDLLSFSARYEIPIDRHQIQASLSRYIRDLFDNLTLQDCGDTCTYIARLFSLLRANRIEPDLTIPQKTVFSYLTDWRKKLTGKHRKDDSVLRQKDRDLLVRLLTLCDVMGIYADDLKSFCTPGES